ncbi:hypothetical protein D9M71_699840 [compost metagenome]
MPGPHIFIHQLVDGGALVVADQVMAADLTVGQQLQRTLQRSIGVMHHHKLHAAVVIGRRVAGVETGAAGAAGKHNQR